MKKQFLHLLLWFPSAFLNCNNNSEISEKRVKELVVYTGSSAVCGSIITGYINDKGLNSPCGTTLGFASGVMLGGLIRNYIPYLEERVSPGIIETVGGITGAALVTNFMIGTESIVGPLCGSLFGVAVYSVKLAFINYKQTKKNDKTLRNLNTQMDKRLENQKEEKNNTDMTNIAIERLNQQCDEIDRQLLLQEKDIKYDNKK